MTDKVNAYLIKYKNKLPTSDIIDWYNLIHQLYYYLLHIITYIDLLILQWVSKYKVRTKIRIGNRQIETEYLMISGTISHSLFILIMGMIKYKWN